jgi:hypothetical protein
MGFFLTSISLIDLFNFHELMIFLQLEQVDK